MNTRAKYALLVLIVAAAGILAASAIRDDRMKIAQLTKTLAERDVTIENLKQQASDQEKRAITPQSWDFAQQGIREQHATIEKLKAQLDEAKANPAAQLLAKSGHVMNEEQCRAWAGIAHLTSPQ